eukprot:COSAG01_NODE_8120_length_2914_cov_2.256838_1_plen_123_part_00
MCIAHSCVVFVLPCAVMTQYILLAPSCRNGAAQSAISVNNGANQLASTLTAVMGGVWSERYGKRRVLVCGFLGILWVNFIFAFTSSYSVVFFFNMWAGFVGGSLGAPINGDYMPRVHACTRP